MVKRICYKCGNPAAYRVETTNDRSGDDNGLDEFLYPCNNCLEGACKELSFRERSSDGIIHLETGDVYSVVDDASFEVNPECNVSWRLEPTLDGRGDEFSVLG